MTTKQAPVASIDGSGPSAVAHFTVAERAARGKAARARGPALEPRPVDTASAPPGPHRPARRAGSDARSRARADPLRADARLAVHLLPRRRVSHGLRPLGRPAHRPARTALRRRAPLELRRVHGAGPRPRLQRQRLRRDASRAVRVGRQAARRRASPSRAATAASTTRSGRRSASPPRRPTARRCSASRRCALSISGTPVLTSRGSQKPSASRRAPKAIKTFEQERRQGADEGQPARIRQAHRDGRWPAEDRQRPAADRSG